MNLRDLRNKALEDVINFLEKTKEMRPNFCRGEDERKANFLKWWNKKTQGNAANFLTGTRHKKKSNFSKNGKPGWHQFFESVRDRTKEKTTFQNGKPKFINKTCGKYKGVI